MRVKRAAMSVMPSSLEHLLRATVHHRNARLSPDRYRSELKRWYWLSVGQECHLDDPQTLGEKIQWLKLYDSTPLKGRLADKYLVRRWVAERVGEEYLVPLYGVWDSPRSIDFDSLPEQFVLKTTHGSGWNIIVRDKTDLDVRRVRRRLDRWLRLRTAMTGGFELHYEFCHPRIICEAYLQDDSGGLRDYKVMTFDGEPQFIVGMQDRHRSIAMGTYLPDWTPAPFHYAGCRQRQVQIPRPRGLERMLGIARELGRGFACARVDLYEAYGRVYFGEMTFTDSNGLTRFYPSYYDVQLGHRLRLPDKKPFKGVML